VKVIEIDRMGRVNMSKNAADLELGRISAEDMPPPREPRSRGDRDRGGRGGDRGGRGGDRGGHSDRNRDRNGGRRR
ncbi:MAG TPA: hypothetical protein PLI07_01970, partial [Candidatus Hydrogenedentes bacterium]|nr:hypothetical protein [Candidatus Hydrogenedentota bacterium]